MRTDLCTTCGGPFKSDRDGLWSGDKREHRLPGECVAFLQQQLAEARALLETVCDAWDEGQWNSLICMQQLSETYLW